MKTNEARNENTYQKYVSAVNKIEISIRRHEKCAKFGYDELPNKVVEMLSNKGYDIRFFKSKNPKDSFMEVTRENSSKGIKGKIVYEEEKDEVDNTQYEELLDALVPIVAITYVFLRGVCDILRENEDFCQFLKELYSEDD